MLIFIVALLGEHCNFDRLRREHENLAADINAISNVSFHAMAAALSLTDRRS
jgi:cohesin loading factor subunit SCC2